MTTESESQKAFEEWTRTFAYKNYQGWLETSRQAWQASRESLKQELTRYEKAKAALQAVVGEL